MKKSKILIMAIVMIIGTSIASLATNESVMHRQKFKSIVQVQGLDPDILPNIPRGSIIEKLKSQIEQLRQLEIESKSIYQEIEQQRKLNQDNRKIDYKDYKKSLKSIKGKYKKIMVLEYKNKYKTEDESIIAISRQIKNNTELCEKEHDIFKKAIRQNNEVLATSSINKVINYKKQIIELERQLLARLKY